MRRWRTGLGTADVQDARGEIDLNPPSEGRPARQPSRFSGRDGLGTRSPAKS